MERSGAVPPQAYPQHNIHAHAPRARVSTHTAAAAAAAYALAAAPAAPPMFMSPRSRASAPRLCVCTVPDDD